ncbi:MAG: MarR family transcriptional regulator [Legionellales bacterium]|nr:MarR family transcriptional regulator [Legionellales bacterium]|tara:strand:+ start:70 stop:528 length:459 start_codon:yes stop_codon:yes gene_type:complete
MKNNKNLLLKNQLCFALYAATNSITRVYRPKLDKVGITYPQYLVLLVLWEFDGLTIKELATRLRLNSAMITPLVKRLEKIELIFRKRNSEDERKVNVFLTTKGKKLENSVSELQKQVASRTDLSDSNFYKLRDTLHNLVDTLSMDQSSSVVD